MRYSPITDLSLPLAAAVAAGVTEELVTETEKLVTETETDGESDTTSDMASASGGGLMAVALEVHSTAIGVLLDDVVAAAVAPNVAVKLATLRDLTSNMCGSKN